MSLETMSNNRNIDSELSWKIIETYFKGQHLGRCIRHQLESYNDFTRTQIQKTIDMFNPVTIHSEQDFDPDSQKYKLELIITFTNFHIYCLLKMFYIFMLISTILILKFFEVWWGYSISA